MKRECLVDTCTIMMQTRSRTFSSTNNTSAIAPTLTDVIAELKLLRGLINDNAEKAATREDVNKLKEIIEKQNTTITDLENKIGTLEGEIQDLKAELDEKEQYQRRTSLRLFNGLRVKF